MSSVKIFDNGLSTSVRVSLTAEVMLRDVSLLTDEPLMTDTLLMGDKLSLTDELVELSATNWIRLIVSFPGLSMDVLVD